MREKEKERDTFSMSESKVTIFLPTFRKKYVFIISFIFDYIPFVIEISAPLRESPLCRKPIIALREVDVHYMINFDIPRAPRCRDIFFFYSAARSTLIKVNYLTHVMRYVRKNCWWIVNVPPLLFVNEMSCKSVFLERTPRNVLYIDLIVDTQHE